MMIGRSVVFSTFTCMAGRYHGSPSRRRPFVYAIIQSRGPERTLSKASKAAVTSPFDRVDFPAHPLNTWPSKEKRPSKERRNSLGEERHADFTPDAAEECR